MFKEICIKKRYIATDDLRKKRKKLGLTIQQVIDKIGCSKSYYCRVENKNAKVTEAMAIKISGIFKKKDDL